MSSVLRWVFRRVLYVGAALLASMSVLLPTTAAIAALPPGTGSGPNYCPQYGSTNSPYSLDNVYACATTASSGWTPFDHNGTQSFQCLELSARFLWAVYGIWATGIGTGAQLVSAVHSSYPTIPVGYPAPGSVPRAGDVISLGPGGGSDPTYGHTAVVIDSKPSTGTFTIMSQNDPEGYAGKQTLQVDLTGQHNGRALFHGSWTTASWLAVAPRTAASMPKTGTLAGDVNGDGRTDLVAVNDASTWVMLSTGSGFSSPQQWFNQPFYGS
jgi:hypothetical protein